MSAGPAGVHHFTTATLVFSLAALAILPYLNALHAGLVFDDRYLASSHPAMQGTFSLVKVLTSPYWGEVKEAMLWRPVTTFSLAVDQRIGGGAASWFHLINLILHAAVTVLWALLVRRLTGRAGLAFITGALFAVHPLHTEAVTWVSGRAELLAAGFGIASLHLALFPGGHRWTRWLAPLLILLAVAAKESAATIPLVLVFLTVAFAREPGSVAPKVAPRGGKGSPFATQATLSPKEDRDVPQGGMAVRPSLPLLIAAFASIPVYVVARRLVLGTWAGPVPDPMDNPMVSTGMIGRLPTVFECAGRYVALVLWPARLSLDYSAPALVLVRGVTPLLVFGLVATAALVWLAIRRPRAPEGLGAWFAILTFALASNLPVVIGTIFGERLFYLPSAGILLAIASAGCALAGGRVRLPARALQAALVLLLVAGAVRTWIRNRDYRDERTFYTTGVRIMPKSPKMRFNDALELRREGRYEDAIREAVEAIRLNPSSRESREVLAASLDSLGRGDEAIPMLAGFLRQDPKDRVTRRNLITLLMKKGEKARADSLAEAGMRDDPDFPEWIGRSARAAQERGDFAHAIDLWWRGRAAAPDAPDAAMSLAWCLLASGDARGACDAYRDALRIMPGSADAANGLAWSLLESGGDAAEAVGLAEKAISESPTATNFDTLARAYIAVGRCADAVQAAEKSIALAPEKGAYRERLDQARRCR